jgi:hypothetical protein
MQLSPAELERRQALRDLVGCFTCEGRVRRQTRNQLEQFLHHHDPEIREIARDMVCDSGGRQLAHEFLEKYSFDDGFLEHRSFINVDSLGTDDLSNFWIENGPVDDDSLRLADPIGVWIESESCPADLFDSANPTGGWIESGGSPGAVRRFDDTWNTPF